MPKIQRGLVPAGLIFGNITVASWPLRSYVPPRPLFKVFAEKE